MIRPFTRLLCASLLLGACSSSGSSGPAEPGAEERLVGGWDGASTTGTSILLIREDLSGTLSATHLRGTEREYQLSFSVSGDVSEDDDQVVLLDLACAEARTRRHDATAPEDEGVPSDDSEAEVDDTPSEDVTAWEALDCAGWGLQLECGFAGECTSDCNLFCDVVYFGDAFATAAIELSGIEDELDHWQRA